MKQALYDRLVASSGVGAVVANRIYATRAPTEAVMPYLVYTRLSIEHFHHSTGASGMAQAQFQIAAYATTAAGLDAVTEAVRVDLDGLQQVALGSVAVRSCVLINEIDGVELPHDGTEQGIFKTFMTFQITYTETIPTL